MLDILIIASWAGESENEKYAELEVEKCIPISAPGICILPAD